MKNKIAALERQVDASPIVELLTLLILVYVQLHEVSQSGTSILIKI